MVVNLSYKLTHLAQSLRPQHHFTSLRSAFPSASTSSPGFDFTSNVFGAAQNAASNAGTSAGGATAIGLAAGAVGAGAGASAGAGPGGSSSKAGSWGSHWGFQVSASSCSFSRGQQTDYRSGQTGKSITQAQAAQTDSTNSNSDEDNLRNALSSPHRRILPNRRSSISNTPSSAAFAFRLRRNASIVPTDLLHAEEAGLSSVRVRLSSAEMQRRYHSAFSQGKRTDEVEEMQKEHEQIDLGPERVEAELVRKTGRRASISEQPMSPRLEQRRDLHTSAARTEERDPSPSRESTPFTKEPPPSATKATRRRNSTSSPSTVPLDRKTFSGPKVTRVSERRPPTSSAVDSGRSSNSRATYLNKEQLVSCTLLCAVVTSTYKILLAQEKENAIRGAEGTRKIAAVEAAVRSYLADPSTWSTRTHNVALAALFHLRKPDTPLDTIVTLYNQLFEHESLRPNLASYELILRAFCRRDEEVRKNIQYIQKRMKKKELAGAARGAWNVSLSPASDSPETGTPVREGDENRYILEREEQRMTALRSPEFDYFTPALQIYRALGALGDRLSTSVVSTLLEGAVARRDVDLALELFSRIEKSRNQAPTIKSYGHLIGMYGSVEKDKELVMDVFEAFLAARADGTLRSPAASQPGPKWRATSVKHKYDTSPEYILVDDAPGSAVSRDEWVWNETIRSLFAAGDPAGAVALLERLLSAQGSPEPLPAGYPESMSTRTVAQVVKGFTEGGDEEASRRWFDRLANPESDSHVLPPPQFYAMCLAVAIDARNIDLANHIYRALLARASADFRIGVGEFFTVTDMNLARAWKATEDEERNRIFDTIIEFRKKFEAATKQGYLSDEGTNFKLSTGLLGRIIQTLGYFARFSEAQVAFNEYANIVRAVMARAAPNASVAEERGTAGRTRVDWVVRMTDVASGALGLKPAIVNGRLVTDGYVSPNLRPSLGEAVNVVTWSRKLRHVVGWAPQQDQMLAVVESYLRDRDLIVSARGGRYSGDHWYTILESFAHAQALLQRGRKFDFEFTSFDQAFEDFVQSGATIPQGFENYDYAGFVRALKAGGLPRGRILEVISVLNEGLVTSAEAEQEPAEMVEKAVAEASLPASPPTTDKTTRERVETPSQAIDEALPTPPATPPSYFAELAPAPTFEFENLDHALGARVESLVWDNKLSDALALVHSAAHTGKFAYPDAYGRLVEALGRQHRVQDVRQVYLLGYSALQAMSSEPAVQSISWVRLEDKMVIALAQAGELVDVGHHRDRLIQAGCAPSADGYAAMILNMKETTDDAAVALMLFEESQRYNVTPNVYLFNTLISKLSRARRAKEALEYFELMKTFGIRPTSITYGAIINACCKTGDDVAADYLFREMVNQADFKPRVPPYNTMIQFYTSTKPDRARALQYYDELVRNKVAPTGHTYKLLLDAYGSIGEPDLDEMQQVFGRLVRDKRVSVTGAHWASMITAYGAVARDLDRAVAIFDSIAHHPSTVHNPNGPLPDAVVYEALLNAILVNGKPELCDQYLEQMKNKGVRMTAYVANSLIKVRTCLLSPELASFRATQRSLNPVC